MRVARATLCWDCAKACGGCSWSDWQEHTPVPGWVAEPTMLRMNNDTYTRSYIVDSCPEFVRDPPAAKERRDRWAEEATRRGR